MRVNTELFVKGKNLLKEDLQELFTARKFSVEPELLHADKISSSIGHLKSRWSVQGDSSDIEEPVFLFSAGWRSGSTLLQRLILSSGEVALWGEPLGNSGVIARLCHSLTVVTNTWPPESYLAGNQDFDGPENKWVANLTPSIEHLRNAHREFLLHWLMVPARDNWKKKRWGLKEVRLTVHHAIYLKWLFPRAKFVFMYRHPYDAYRSWKGNRWRDCWPSYYRLSPISFSRHWRLLVDGYIEHSDKVEAMVIKFEDLIGDKINLEKLAKYLEVQGFDERILQRKIRGPVQASAHLRNRKLTIFDRFIIRQLCGNRMQALGYEA